MIQTLVVDDDPFIRESLKVILNTMEGIEVIGTCQNGLEAYEYVKSGQPVDVVLMDIRMPECDGVEGTRLVKECRPDVIVLILTTFDDDEFIVQALRNGAGGYLLKNVPPERIASGIHAVYSGNVLIHPDVAKKLGGLLQPAASRDDSGSVGKKRLADFGLTSAEEQVVRKIADGLSNREIAKQLFLSEGTVKNYITEILSKLALRDRTQIAIFYLKEIDEGPSST